MVNAEFRTAKKPNEPAFDWLTFDDLQLSMDRTLQESAAFYNPSMQVIVFVFLPSKSGNSVAIWRRKLHVPNNVRLMLQGEISLAIAGLRKEKDYLIHVDECVFIPVLLSERLKDRTPGCRTQANISLLLVISFLPHQR